MAIPSSILAWRIPWIEEPGGLQSTGLQRIRHDWGNLAEHDLSAGIKVIVLTAHLSSCMKIGAFKKVSLKKFTLRS